MSDKNSKVVKKVSIISGVSIAIVTGSLAIGKIAGVFRTGDRMVQCPKRVDRLEVRFDKAVIKQEAQDKVTNTNMATLLTDRSLPIAEVDTIALNKKLEEVEMEE